ncbi:MAG TPA: phosphotransferase [Vicinamibacterales bacterium]|nr:phosphotransferase [Vicinamibacterales bacterium]
MRAGNVVDGRDWPAQFRPVLSKLAAHGQRYFGADRVDLEPVRQLDRPFSTLLQIRIAGSATMDEAFVKILKPRADTPEQIASMRQNVLDDFEMTRRVHDGLASYPGLTAVRPIACFPEDLAIVTEEVHGETLSDLLSSRAAGVRRQRTIAHLGSILRAVGGWLKAAQAALAPDRDVSPERMRAYLDTRLRDLESSGTLRLTAHGRGLIESYRDRLLAESAPDLRAVWIHADFCPENIIVRDGRVTVLDFTMAKGGTVYHDVSHLYLRLDAMKAKPWFTTRVIEHLQRNLLDGFEPGLSPLRPLFSLMLLQHVLCDLVALRSPAGGRIARLYADRLHRRHRHWLARAARLDDRSWTR